jgi:hypothetical protein
VALHLVAQAQPEEHLALELSVLLQVEVEPQEAVVDLLGEVETAALDQAET